MPELPDVEGYRRVLQEHAVDSPITSVEVLDTGVLHGVSVRSLRSALRGKRFGAPRRHGKWLIAPLINGSARGSPKQSGGSQNQDVGTKQAVMLHFGMTGGLEWADRPEERHRHDRVVITFADGELRYHDMRKLQGLRLAQRAEEIDEVLDDLGPDAREVSRTQLRQLLTARSRQIKPALVDQSRIAGLGNLLADEILWRARIHPRRSTRTLRDDDVRRLHRELRNVLRWSIAAGRVPPRKTWLTGRRDDPSGDCPRCGATLRHGRISGRGAVWCPRCQPSLRPPGTGRTAAD